MSKIILNSNYAPGIATYGAQGKQGKIGEPGYALYFIPYDIDDLTKNTNSENNQYKHLINCIKNNRFVTNNSEISVELLVMKNRSYQIGDLFLFPNGKIYRLLSTINISFEFVGELIKKSETFNKTSNVIYNSNNMPILLTNVNDVNDINCDALLNILYNSEDNNKNLLSFIDINSKYNINFKNDNGSLIIDSSNGVYFNNVYVKYSNNLDNNLENGYYRIATFEDEDDSFYEIKTETNELVIYRNKIKTYCEVVTIDPETSVMTTKFINNSSDNIEETIIIKNPIEIIIPLTGSFLSKVIKIK